MGNNNILSSSSNNNNFIDQIKVDGYNNTKIVGTYINPSEFTKSGLIIISQKSKYINISNKKSNNKL